MGARRVAEFPRVAEHAVGQPHRYGDAVGCAAVGSASGSPGLFAPRATLKYDVVTRCIPVISFGPGREPGKLDLVPCTPDAPEDEGVAMEFVYGGPVHLTVGAPYRLHDNRVPTQG
jgi:carotenoid cleavage dioxygenase-like enzyme